MEEKPKKTAGDVGLSIARGVLSGVPFIGGLASEIFNLVLAPPLTKRRDEWMESIAAGLKELEEKVEGFKIKDLSRNESFITTVMQATQAAILNHQKEKLEALRNAVLNAALSGAPGEDLQTIFLNYVDTLSSSHLRLLQLLQKARKPGDYRLPAKDETERFFYGIPPEVIKKEFPDFSKDHDILEAIYNDLSLKELVTEHNNWASSTTPFGDEFLKFISSPIG